MVHQRWQPVFLYCDVSLSPPVSIIPSPPPFSSIAGFGYPLLESFRGVVFNLDVAAETLSEGAFLYYSKTAYTLLVQVFKKNKIK